MATLDVKQVDLAMLAAAIRSAGHGALVGRIVGRTVMRDVTTQTLACSMLEAEHVVDTLIARGFARLETDQEGREHWTLPTGE